MHPCNCVTVFSVNGMVVTQGVSPRTKGKSGRRRPSVSGHRRGGKIEIDFWGLVTRDSVIKTTGVARGDDYVQVAVVPRAMTTLTSETELVGFLK